MSQPKQPQTPQTYNQGQTYGQKNPTAQTFTPQQIPNATVRNNVNNGVKNGQGR